MENSVPAPTKSQRQAEHDIAAYDSDGNKEYIESDFHFTEVDMKKP